MVQQGLNIRDEFKDSVKNFCSLHNVKWCDTVYESVTGGIVGEVVNVVKVMEYIDKLERDRLEERNNKSFWNKVRKIVGIIETKVLPLSYKVVIEQFKKIRL